VTCSIPQRAGNRIGSAKDCRARKARFVLTVALMLVAVCGCRSRDAAQPVTAGAQAGGGPTAMKTVTLPDLSRATPGVQRQLQDRYAALMTATSNAAAAPADLARAYGETGMMFRAAEYAVEAEACFLDAAALAPGDLRWPYYLGHLYRTGGRTDQAATAFERVLAIDGSYAPAMIWLGNTYLDQGRPEAAEPLFANAVSANGRSVAAVFGLGRAALARRDYTAAIAHFEQALAIDPAASVVHYPLALAYRGAGALDKAQAHLLPQGTGELKPADPLLDEVDASLESPVAYEIRGARALAAGKWDDAAGLFRKGVELQPGEPSMRHKLATALAMKGDIDGALAELHETIRRTPSFTKSHYSLGLLQAERGQPAQAIDQFTTALGYDPNYVEARLQLAELLRRTGRAAAALPHYAKVMALDPRLPEARFGYAMALVSTAHYQQAREALLEGTRLHPERAGFALAAARLLAAAPDRQVRDGARALALIEGLNGAATRTLDWGIVMAMSLAAAGRYDEAATWQREAIGFAQQARDRRLEQRLSENLARYQRHEPARLPWSDAEPMELTDTLAVPAS
jgi:tetratricopeptide (TPR) repeat protein